MEKATLFSQVNNLAVYMQTMPCYVMPLALDTWITNPALLHLLVWIESVHFL